MLVDVEESLNDFGEGVLWEVSFFEGVAPTGVCQDFLLVILSQLPVVRPGSHFHIWWLGLEGGGNDEEGVEESMGLAGGGGGGPWNLTSLGTSS